MFRERRVAEPLRKELAAARERLEKRLAKVVEKLANDPTARYLEASAEFTAFLDHRKGGDRFKPAAIRELAEIEIRMAKAAEAHKTYDWIALSDEKAELETALREFDNTVGWHLDLSPPLPATRPATPTATRPTASTALRREER